MLNVAMEKMKDVVMKIKIKKLAISVNFNIIASSKFSDFLSQKNYILNCHKPNIVAISMIVLTTSTLKIKSEVFPNQRNNDDQIKDY